MFPDFPLVESGVGRTAALGNPAYEQQRNDVIKGPAVRPCMRGVSKSNTTQVEDTTWLTASKPGMRAHGATNLDSAIFGSYKDEGFELREMHGRTSWLAPRASLMHGQL